MEDWVAISPKTGTGNSTLNVSVPCNNSSEDRQSDINIQIEDYKKIIKIIQKGDEDMVAQLELEMDSTTFGEAQEITNFKLVYDNKEFTTTSSIYSNLSNLLINNANFILKIKIYDPSEDVYYIVFPNSIGFTANATNIYVYVPELNAKIIINTSYSTISYTM